MALDTFVAGRYSATYNSSDVGITRGGYELQQESRWEDVAETDAYGLSIIDGIYRGGNVYCQFDSKAYKTGSIAAFWPWSNLGAMGVIGRRASDVALSLVLTVTASTPAATYGPATLTGLYSILAPNNPARLLYNSVLREVPVRLLFLPYSSAGTIYWFG